MTVERQRLHARVEGRVQGVGFRYFVFENAQSLGLSGWVRNRWDDSVELVAEGERAALDQLLSAIHSGPRMSFVSSVKTDWGNATGEFTGFSILATQ